MSLCTIDGQRFNVGDVHDKFSIQSTRYEEFQIPIIITIHADPTPKADKATAALAVSFACLARSLLSLEISSTTRSIAVFMHSIARIKIPPIINNDLSETEIGNAIAVITETAFAKTH